MSPPAPPPPKVYCPRCDRKCPRDEWRGVMAGVEPARGKDNAPVISLIRHRCGKILYEDGREPEEVKSPHG